MRCCCWQRRQVKHRVSRPSHIQQAAVARGSSSNHSSSSSSSHRRRRSTWWSCRCLGSTRGSRSWAASCAATCARAPLVSRCAVDAYGSGRCTQPMVVHKQCICWTLQNACMARELAPVLVLHVFVWRHASMCANVKGIAWCADVCAGACCGVDLLGQRAAALPGLTALRAQQLAPFTGNGSSPSHGMNR